MHKNSYIWTIDKKDYASFLKNGRIRLIRRFSKAKTTPLVGDLVKFNNFDIIGEIINVEFLAFNLRTQSYATYEITVANYISPPEGKVAIHNLCNFRPDYKESLDNGLYAQTLLNQAQKIFDFVDHRQYYTKKHTADLFGKFWLEIFPRCATRALDNVELLNPSGNVFYIDITRSYFSYPEIFAVALLSYGIGHTICTEFFIKDFLPAEEGLWLSIKLFRKVLTLVEPFLKRGYNLRIYSGSDFTGDEAVARCLRMFVPTKYKYLIEI